VLFVAFGGGGGWGDPLEREPEKVVEDVLDEYVSLKSARRDYGVVIEEHTMTVDEEATRRLRKQLSEERAAKPGQDVVTVKYLSEEWQRLCQDAVNADEEFAKLAGGMTLELNNIIEDCPDGKTRFLYWRFVDGRLEETISGLIDEFGSGQPFFTTIATYHIFRQINTAKMKVEQAVMEGKLRFEGELARMMEHADALARFDEVRRQIPTEY
jgi:putative sterol carrier protein